MIKIKTKKTAVSVQEKSKKYKPRAIRGAIQFRSSKNSENILLRPDAIQRRCVDNERRWERKLLSNLKSLEVDLKQLGEDRIKKLKEKCGKDI
jgi:hypothetical protein